MKNLNEEKLNEEMMRKIRNKHSYLHQWKSNMKIEGEKKMENKLETICKKKENQKDLLKYNEEITH